MRSGTEAGFKYITEYSSIYINRSQGESRRMPTEQGCSPRELIAWVEEEVRESLRVKQAFLQECAKPLAAICAALAERLERGGKLLLFGNGGSAADAQHITAEFVGRHPSKPAANPPMGLTVNRPTLTAALNDY